MISDDIQGISGFGKLITCRALIGAGKRFSCLIPPYSDKSKSLFFVHPPALLRVSTLLVLYEWMKNLHWCLGINELGCGCVHALGLVFYYRK